MNATRLKNVRVFFACIFTVLELVAYGQTNVYSLDLTQKTISFKNQMALGESATVELRGIGESDPTNLTIYLSNKYGDMLAITEGMVATGAYATAKLLLNSTNLLAEFAGISPQGIKSLDFSVWDSGRSVLLASAPVEIRNNPIWESLLFTNLPTIETLGLSEYLSRNYVWSNATATARYTIDLGWKDLSFSNSMALAERAVVEIRGIGDADPSGLMLYLSNRQFDGMALARYMVAGADAGSAIGMLNLATTNLLAEFEGSNPRAEKTFDLSVWDSGRDILLGSASVLIRNNPLAVQFVDGWTNLPTITESEVLASIADAVARASNAQTMASNAVLIAEAVAVDSASASNALSIRIGAVQTNLNAASNALYQLIGVVDSSVLKTSNSLSARIGLEETNRAAAVGTIQTNLNAASNLASQANSSAIAAHAAISNLPPIPDENDFVPTNRTITINGEEKSLSDDVEFTVAGGGEGIDATTATNISLAVAQNGYVPKTAVITNYGIPFSAWTFSPTNGVIGFASNTVKFLSRFSSAYNSMELLVTEESGARITMPDSFYVDGMKPLKASTLQTVAIATNGSLYRPDISAGVRLTTTVGWNTNGYWPMTNNDSVFILTNTSSYVISQLSIATDNTNGLHLASLDVSVNGGESQPLSDLPVDYVQTSYDLLTYAYPGDVLEIQFVEGMPDVLGRNNEIRVKNLVAYSIANTNYLGTTADIHGRKLLVDLPTLGRQAANKNYVDVKSSETFANARSEIYERTYQTDLNGFDFIRNPRHVEKTYSNSFAHLYSGQTVFEIDGEGSTVIPQIVGFEVESGDVTTMTVYSYSGGASNLLPEVSTNLQEWVRLDETAILSATNIDEYTAQVVFTNAADRMMFVRLVDVSGGTGVPVTRITGKLELNGIEITGGGGTGATFFVQGGTNVTVQTNGNNYVVSSGGGTVLYYNVTADSTAVGNYALASTNGTAVGTAAWADTYGAALGDTAYAPRSGAALGADTIATDYGVAVGRGAQAQHTNVAIGALAQATGQNSVSIGAGAVNDMDNTVMIGNEATTQTVARGTLKVDSIALGTNPPTAVWPQGGGAGTTNIFDGAGTTGLVKSTTADTNKYLRGDGTWQTVQAGSSGGITNFVVNGFSVPQTNGQAYLNITTSGGVFASNTPGNVELFLSSFPAWAGIGSNRVSFTAITNSPQFFTVPAGVTNLAACVWGGGGWGGSCAGGSSFVSFPVTPGENLELRVALAPLSISITNDFVPGAWPGGGTGFRTNAGIINQAGGYCGVFRGENPLVISGGGGATTASGSGGAGGGISGGNASSGGGTQLAGGYAQSTNQTAGSYLQGGGALSTNVISYGGGGGYFGGGGCGYGANSGAGSGFVNGSLGVFGYTFRGQVGTELPEYITGKGGAGQSGLIVLGY